MSKYFLVGLVAVVIAAFGAVSYYSPKENPALNSSLLVETSEAVEITTQDVTYFENTTGYLARPAAAEAYPGIVMIHEWWGLNDNIKAMANQLAQTGYVVLAVDLYDGQVAQAPERARELSSSLNQERATTNLRQAANYLRTNQQASKVASLGWCFGGGQSLQVSLSGEPLDATVIYYGRLTSDKNQLSAIKWPVLGIFGAEDTSIPVESVNAFQQALNELGIRNEIHVYPGVGHAFANPSGQSYAPEETRDAWEKTVSFLDENLK